MSKKSTLINYFRHKSIQFIITVSFMLVTILGMLYVGITLYSRFSKINEQNAITNTRQIINQVNLSLDYYLTSMMEISNYSDELIYYSEDLSDKKLKDQMNAIINSRNDIVTLAVFSKDGEMIFNLPSYKLKENANITSEEWFKTPVKEPGNLFFSSPHVQNIFEGQHNWVVSLSRQITFNRNGEKVEGVLLVDMNFNSIDQICKDVGFGKKGYIYIIDSKGNIVYHPQQQLINNGLKQENINEVLDHVFGRYFDEVNGEKRLITIETVNHCRWRVVGVAYMDEISTIKKDLWSYFIYVLALGALIVIIISMIISAKISRPIKMLEKSMKKVEQGDFDINIDIKGEAEVAKLSKTFNLMVTRIRQLMEQIVYEQEQKRKSEINALQAQINPHFLYNTLDSIVWMAENGNSQEVITMVTALARLFRISISRGKNIITVQQELEHAKNYLIIQNIRYKNKFKFEIEAEEKVLQYKTFKLILQPIIENSIYHGIEYMVDEGFIKVSVKESEDKLLFQVEDNGLGMTQETLSNILNIEPGKKGESGVGVKNVDQRIKLYYGKQYGLEIESELEQGTKVSIWLPIVKDDMQEEER